jgi:glycerol-3-phosphate dehydrogenase
MHEMVTREETIRSLESESFDLLIIGGGITGAGIALDAASRGLKVALIEKEDFAYGTSSRSTKLIHGGLRYLKQLEFALVKEVGSERAIVHHLAPHLVVPEKMLLPLYERRGLGYWLTSLGLKIYDWLAGVKGDDQRRMLTKPQTLKFEPLLKSDDIKGGAIYAEYRTDDARLTIEIIKLAVAKGAFAANYVELKNFDYASGRICSVQAIDQETQKTITIRSTSFVNATGPWVDEVRTINQSRHGKTLHLTKGVHIVVPYHRLAVRQAIYFDVPDGRMIFAIPRGRVTYIGTTDTDYEASLDKIVTTREDASYLIRAVNEMFPSVHLTMADIESSWAGLRPLIHEEGKSASELSRKDELFESETGLISIAGGKLTGYRKMAERVIDRIIELYFKNRTLKSCHTHTLVLPGGHFTNRKAVQELETSLAARMGTLGLRGNDAINLIHLYGSQAWQIMTYFENHQSGSPEQDLLEAEMMFAMECEMARFPLDFIIRRSGLLYFNHPKAVREANRIVAFFAKQFQWSPELQIMEETKVNMALEEVLLFKL